MCSILLNYNWNDTICCCEQLFFLLCILVLCQFFWAATWAAIFWQPLKVRLCNKQACIMQTPGLILGSPQCHLVVQVKCGHQFRIFFVLLDILFIFKKLSGTGVSLDDQRSFQFLFCDRIMYCFWLHIGITGENYLIWVEKCFIHSFLWENCNKWIPLALLP